MNDYKTYFIRFIRENFPINFEDIIAETDSHYKIISVDTAFAKTSKNPVDRRLDFCAYFLALIKTLDQRGEAFENIRKICLQITVAYVQPKNKVQGFFNRLFPKLTTTWLGKTLIKALHKRSSINSNTEGFIGSALKVGE